MTITEVIRERTLSLRDSLEVLDRQLEKARNDFKAADARVKRCGTEISKCREKERNHKRSMNAAATKVEQAQQALDDLERKRQKALDTLLRVQKEQDEAAHFLGEAQSATQSAQSEIRHEQKKTEDMQKQIEALRSKRADIQSALGQALLQALDVHLMRQLDRVTSAFKTQAEQAESVRAFAEFKAARHSDPDISSMCEQREELLKLLNSAVVPSVQQMLRGSLTDIESRIEQRFPGALAPRASLRDGSKDDLLYYCGSDGKAVLLLPITSDVWGAASQEALHEDSTRAMCLVWSLLRELKLKAEDGCFIEARGWITFVSEFDMEEIAILHGFSVTRHGAEILGYVLSAVPAELQEAILNED